MKIKSRFKDYYDYVANKYGGGDPRVVYSRTRLGESDVSIEFPAGNLRDLPTVRSRSVAVLQHHGYRVGMHLVIAGRLYLLTASLLDGEPAPQNISAYRVEPPLTEKEKKDHSWDSSSPWWRRSEIEWGVENKFLVELCRAVGHPVFAIRGIELHWRDSRATYSIAAQCPILRDVGMPKHVSPEQMYQNIAYFVGNLMKAAPDTEPPVALGNRARIEKAGFDFVTSFRHRK